MKKRLALKPREVKTRFLNVRLTDKEYLFLKNYCTENRITYSDLVKFTLGSHLPEFNN